MAADVIVEMREDRLAGAEAVDQPLRPVFERGVGVAAAVSIEIGGRARRQLIEHRPQLRSEPARPGGERGPLLEAIERAVHCTDELLSR